MQHASLSYCQRVPYEITFTKPVTVADPDIYINDCCWGGDAIRDELLPLITSQFERVRTGQEDWGWYIWFRQGRIHLEVNIYCDDIQAGSFRMWLESHRRKLFGRSIADEPELERVRKLVCSHLAHWASALNISRV